MLKELIDFKETGKEDKEVELSFKKVSKNDVAVIGMYGKFPLADSIEIFWENLLKGKDCIRDFPKNRWNDIKQTLPNSYMPADPPQLCEAGYLDEIDKFDYEFFNLSLSESKLIDPNQRLFLEACWGCIEDAGYGSRIRGTKTGVYVGHSSDMKFEYHMLVNLLNAEQYEQISLPGNVKSIIASRISYLLDLKGPSMVIDTACSSGLTAIHLACQAITNGECDMALAGGVKINIFPIQKGMDNEIGIRSPQDRARTFDDSSDGIGSGEGVIAIMLKPLHKAVQDKDHIYAVIKGSAINQDGNSVGITAPNSLAQQDVILNAWKNANVESESISYIEAHGTATKLGDPIEISGIQRAFQKYTNKKSFCGIGAVKTNIGHFDQISGLAGFVKLVLALSNKEIPKTLHFKRPNRNIDFIDSPLYIVDQNMKWESNGKPLMGGVSSFGLSGTNCHMVVEEYKKRDVEIQKIYSQHILTLSAKDEEVLKTLVMQFQDFLKSTDELIEDICFTQNTGRMHHNYRVVIIGDTKEDFVEKLNQFSVVMSSGSNCFYGWYRIVPAIRMNEGRNEISGEIQRELTEQANEIVQSVNLQNDVNSAFVKLGELYIKGAEIEWENLYKKEKRRKTSNPVYPFKRSRCWIDYQISRPIALKADRINNQIHHPLIEECLVKTAGLKVYSVNLNAETHWLLNEHKVLGQYVLPGTAYLEMALQACTEQEVGKVIEFSSVLFLSPLTTNGNETRETNIIIQEKNSAFMIASRENVEEEWSSHVEGEVRTRFLDMVPVLDINNKIKSEHMSEIHGVSGEDGIVQIGPRWTHVKRRLYANDEHHYVAYFRQPDEFDNELEQYFFHPALMDRAINAANDLVGESSYLPFSYKKLTVYGTTPKEFYSYIVKKNSANNNQETVCFDVVLADIDGKVFAKADSYTIKRVGKGVFGSHQEEKSLYHEIVWKRATFSGTKSRLPEGYVLIIKDSKQDDSSLLKQLKNDGKQLIEVTIALENRKVDDSEYVISGKEADYLWLLSNLKKVGITQILHIVGCSYVEEVNHEEELRQQIEGSLCSLFYLTKALVFEKYRDVNIILFGAYANAITKTEDRICPLNSALFAMGKVVAQEYPNLKLRCIDIDNSTKMEKIPPYLEYSDYPYEMAFRGDVPYVSELKSMDLYPMPMGDDIEPALGAWIITGGLGGLGLEMCKYLASRNRKNIVLIGRTKMPERREWQDVLEDNKDSKMCRAIRSVMGFEKQGIKITSYSADVGNYEQMKLIMNQIREEYGSICGIIHCAGVAGDGFLIRKDEKTFYNVINPKIYGTWILDKLTEKDKLECFILFSSVSSVVPSVGQSDYTAANAYLDGFAYSRNKRGKRTIAINWPAWVEVGMAVDYRLDESQNTFYSITNQMAEKILDTVLQYKVPRVIVGEINYEVLNHKILNQMKLFFEKNESRKTVKGEQQNYEPKDTGINHLEKSKQLILKGGVDEEVFSKTECKIAELWADLLGIHEIDVYSSFNSMGGDSIMATRLLKKIEVEYPGRIDIADIFAYPTINEMAEYIDSYDKKAVEESKEEDVFDLDELLEQLEKGQISVDEAESRY